MRTHCNPSIDMQVGGNKYELKYTHYITYGSGHEQFYYFVEKGSGNLVNAFVLGKESTLITHNE